jgi:DNA-binding YbaB/EbfC family protein
MAGFGGFGLGKIKEAFQKANQLKERSQELQQELEEMRLDGEAGGGLVKVTVSGNQEPQGIVISPEAMEQGKEVLEDLVLTAMRNAYQLSAQTMKNRMEELTNELGLPGSL